MTAPSGAAGARHAYLRVVCVLIATIGFSGKAVIVKLAYQYPVDVMTLLALLRSPELSKTPCLTTC